MLYRIWRKFTTWPGVSLVLGLVLLAAAILKGYELATEALAEDSLLTSRWFLIIVVEWEVFLALWLLGGFYRPWLRTTRWMALLYFAVLFEMALIDALSGHSSCHCFGKMYVNPWVAVGTDLVAVFLLAIVTASVVHQEALQRRQWFGLAGVFAVFGMLSLITMASYSTQGAIPRLRGDIRLHDNVTIELPSATTEDILEIGRKATGLHLTVDEVLRENQPHYGQWALNGTRLWAVMELLVRQQTVPARWEMVNDDYAMVPAAWFGKSLPFWVVSAVLLSLTMIGMRLLDVDKDWNKTKREGAIACFAAV